MIHNNTNNRQLAIWLFICAASVFLMIVLGGVTRLTHSGLSMVEWKPLLGIIPPLSGSDWLLTFEKYKAFPEYQKTNLGMSLQEFKLIFYFEYFHRLLGRLIGLIFFIPLIYFYIKNRIPRPLLPKLALILVLGGLQGLLGWYMVKSGLINEPRVSQYRLTAHLGLAVVIYAGLIWIGMNLWGNTDKISLGSSNRRLYFYALCLTGFIFLIILSGGLVAGTRAGFAYNTFPLMAGSFIPQGIFAMSPLWQNFFENIISIQFNHRVLAYLLTIFVISLSIALLRSETNKKIKIAAMLLIAALALQASLGIATLLYLVPVALASLHQAGAILLFTVSLILTHQLRQSA